MSDCRPIGIFDSGLGGLTVVREILRLMPHERIIYLGDTARSPYGGRSEETIKSFGLQCANHFLKHDIKMLVVACNTVSSVALELIEKKIKDIPVIGVVLPGARAAVLRTAEYKIGVIGTPATVNAQAYFRAINNLDPNIKVYGRACPLFVPLVEAGLFDHDISRLTAQHYLYEMIDLGVDCIILGCTHYPLLLEVIQGTVGTRIQLLDSALWTAKEVQDILTALNCITSLKDDGFEKSSFLFTDITVDTGIQAELFLGRKLTSLQKVTLDI